MEKTSIFRSAYFDVLRISSLLSIILISLVSVILYLGIQRNYLLETSKRVKALIGASHGTAVKTNYPLLIRDIQRKVLLQELILVGQDCDILASTTFQTNPCSQKNQFEVLDLHVNGNPVSVYFRSNYTLNLFLREHWQILISILGIVFITLYSFLIFFMNRSVIRPISTAIHNLKHGDLANSFPIEFKILRDKLQEFHLAIAANEAEKSRYEMVKKVVHDIRNPILYLKTVAKKSSESNEVRRAVQAIEHQIDNLLPNNRNEMFTMNISELLTEISQEVYSMYNVDVVLDTAYVQEEVSLNLHPLDLKNIFLNLIRNSVEAGSRRISIRVQSFLNEVTFKIMDDGSGIDKEIVSKLFNQKVTSKIHGNGIGLSSINEFLLSRRGRIRCDADFTMGACFEIILEKSSVESREIILIDDDKFVHLSWKDYAKNKNIPVYCFFSIDDFLEKSDHFEKLANVFVDSNLKGEIKGEIASEKIFKLGFSNIFICSFDYDIELSLFPWIKGRVSKQPSF